MIVSPDKASMTIERLAIENYFLSKNIKLNIKELNKRKQKIKNLKELYELEINSYIFSHISIASSDKSSTDFMLEHIFLANDIFDSFGCLFVESQYFFFKS